MQKIVVKYKRVFAKPCLHHIKIKNSVVLDHTHTSQYYGKKQNCGNHLCHFMFIKLLIPNIADYSFRNV